MNIYIACELNNLEKKIIKNNLKRHTSRRRISTKHKKTTAAAHR